MKKSKNKDRIVNVNPFHAELVKSTENGFELWLYSSIGDDYSRRYIYKIHFERYWLSFLASILWKVIRKDMDRLAQDVKAMEGK